MTAALVLVALTALLACVSLDVRTALLVAVASHAIMRLWSGLDFVPKAVAFERADPATIDRAQAVRWTRRSPMRLPLDVVTCGAALTALALVS